MNSLSSAIRLVNKIKEEVKSEEMNELSEVISKSVTQQFVLLYRCRKFMDSVRFCLLCC